MRYKLLAIDLDDTLLGEDLSISERNKSAICKAVEQGVKVTLASGRATQSVAHYLDILGLKIPVISYQGARVTDTATGKVMFKKEIDRESALPVIEYSQKVGVHCNVFVDNTIYIRRMGKWAKYYNTMSPNVPMKETSDLEGIVKETAIKLIYIDDRKRLEEIKPGIEEIMPEDLIAFYSKPNFLEFTNKNATKGEAVKFLAEHFGIKREEVIAIGDTYNDISMIEYAGLGVCMENGTETVKKIADYVTLSNVEDGVAHVIEKFIL